MTPCRDVAPLLLDRSAGALDDLGATRLDEHLAACAACRAEAAALDRTLALVRLPPPDAAERAAGTGLADALRLAQAVAARRRAWPVRVGAGVAVALAIAAFLVAPAFTRRGPELTPEEQAVARAAAAPAGRWIAPDPDEVGLAEALDLDDAQALELREAVEEFHHRREPLHAQLREALQVLHGAADGEPADGAAVDQALARLLDLRAQAQAADQALIQAVTKDQPPARKARAVLFLTRLQHQDPSSARGSRR